MSVGARRDGAAILWFDTELWPDAEPSALDFSGRERGGGARLAGGRGNALVWTRPDGRQWVLRHYRRGGAIARLSADRYVWLGEQRTRAAREFHLLRSLRAEGLPVPRPVAARVVRAGLGYSQDLLTERIAGARPLNEVLQSGPLDEGTWAALGRTLGRFHRAEVGHADLNAANILLDDAGRFHLIDFDRGRRAASAAFQRRSLARLRRSLEKWAAKAQPFNFTAADWEALVRAI